MQRFSHSKNLPFFPVEKEKQEILTIGLIGDSWVTHKKLDGILNEYLKEKGIINKVISSGHSGAKSKMVYHNLFKNKASQYSSKFIIESRPDFCIVIAGVNDAVGQMGSRFYAHHMKNIIKTLLHYDIRPIVVSLPKVGISETNNGMNFIKKFRNIISACINNRAKVDNIESYRNRFNEMLFKENLKTKIILVNYDKACEEFSVNSDLYYNPIHLSLKGNEKLVKLIADTLLKELKLDTRFSKNKS